jgi:hypothetical protein
VTSGEWEGRVVPANTAEVVAAPVSKARVRRISPVAFVVIWALSDAFWHTAGAYAAAQPRVLVLAGRSVEAIAAMVVISGFLANVMTALLMGTVQWWLLRRLAGVGAWWIGGWVAGAIWGFLVTYPALAIQTWAMGSVIGDVAQWIRLAISAMSPAERAPVAAVNALVMAGWMASLTRWRLADKLVWIAVMCGAAAAVTAIDVPAIDARIRAALDIDPGAMRLMTGVVSVGILFAGYGLVVGAATLWVYRDRWRRLAT